MKRKEIKQKALETLSFLKEKGTSEGDIKKIALSLWTMLRKTTPVKTAEVDLPRLKSGARNV